MRDYSIRHILPLWAGLDVLQHDGGHRVGGGGACITRRLETVEKFAPDLDLPGFAGIIALALLGLALYALFDLAERHLTRWR